MMRVEGTTFYPYVLIGMVVLLVAMICLPYPALAHRPTDPPHQLYRMGDFKLESGEVIQDMAVSYVTHGQPNQKKSNAILMVTAIGGNHHRIDFLIGPGKALDTTKYYVVCVDAISNGLGTSPSNSKTQPRMKFPRFTIRDMVHSQYKLLRDHLGIDRVVTVIGPSMGGMQALQWGVSYPEFMDSLVPMVPLAKTPAWTYVMLEMARKAIMLDPAWDNGNYSEIPEKGMRLFWDVIVAVASRNPWAYRYQFPVGSDVLPWLKATEDALVKAVDPNNWIYQCWAYEAHDLGTTPGMGGDLVKALRSIKAKTLLLTSINDVLNPEWEPLEAARYIRDVTCVTINPYSANGHLAASGAIPADVDFLNREIGGFLDLVTNQGKKLQ